MNNNNNNTADNNNQSNNSNSNINIQQISMLLSNTQAQNNQTRTNAERELQQITASCFSQFLLALCHILSNVSEQQSVRVAAGLYLKILVGAESASAEKLDEIRERWSNVSTQTRQQIKNNMLQVLELKDREARNTATNVIANLVAVETLQQWQDLVPKLLTKSQSNDVSFELMHSILLLLGRIAENAATHEDLQPYSSQILQCIAKAMSTLNNEVQSTGMLCLYHMMEFIRTNMTEKEDRDVILQMVCVGANNQTNTALRLHSIMAMCRLSEAYYDLLAPYMHSIFSITKGVIESGVAQKEDPNVTKQAIEVWSVTAETESLIDGDNEQNKENSNNNNNNGDNSSSTADNKRENHGFVFRSLGILVPLYLQALMLQNENFDDDDWDVRKAAGCSLELFAHVCKANILQHVLQFVEKNITHDNWRNREAALCAFGYVLDGPDSAQLLSLVGQILPVVLLMMKNSNKHVKATATWTFGRVCVFVPGAIGDRDVIPDLTAALLLSNQIASKACWCIASLSSYYATNQITSENSLFGNANKAFALITNLLKRTDREDSDGHLITAAHEALNNIVHFAPAQANQMIHSLLPELVNRLKNFCEMCVNNQSDTIMYRIAAVYTTIQVVISKCGDTCIDNTMANVIMQCSCQLSQSKNELVYEEMLCCLTILASCIGENFFNYLSSTDIQRLLLESIDIGNGQNNSQLCQTGAACIGDAYRSCESVIATNGNGNGNGNEKNNIQSFSDQVIQSLLLCLVSQELELDVKPHVMDALMDVSMAHSNYGLRYSQDIITQCLELGAFKTPSDDEFDMALMNEIRGSVVNVCRSILIQLSNDKNDMQLFNNYINGLLAFFETCTQEGDDQLLSSCISLIEEIADYCTMSTITLLRVPQVTQIFDKAKVSKNAELGQQAYQAYQALQARQN